MKLYLLLLGAEAPGRYTEQHDYFFGIADNLKDLVPAAKAFWPEAGNSLHLDGWREVTKVDSYAINIVAQNTETQASPDKLFFLNLGGYTTGKLEEQHYTVLTVQHNRILAAQAAKKTLFFKTNSLKGIATAHIDEKYGVDVDSVHQIEEMLSTEFKEKYQIVMSDGADLPEDEIHLGYFKLDKIK
ncbi:DUF1543 domain-containing protein [Mucilaginibacter polytrichastri]|uniref:DUF1543 domain-containing protein n=1 Tax=Mucilaginibacter polytrichastri TaxID=1302689 RepID=A0A1Q5ZXL3_9SPHI|nr:DUF1543 domain-containing protein [Mucilaginibacter polytrichastri]OKS86489.1 hypothetical protein RG47T_1945 [Mucilaginibacter polytrichastri]SFS78886.1 protein of unknown function [Mucilaginibacter polytrichastri]